MSREVVIRRIVEREQTGRSLTEGAVLRDVPELHQAACERFGAWNTALQYAGVDTRHLSVSNDYSQEGVLRKIRVLCRDGYSIKAIDCQRRDRRMYSAARRYFGSWRGALHAAGVDLRHAGLRRLKPRWLDRQKTFDALREWIAAGNSPTWLDITLRNRKLATAVKGVFGSWRRALIAIGFISETKPAPRNRKWDSHRVIEGIRSRRREGKPLRSKGVRKDNNALLCAALRYFGSWDDALAAAGIEPE